MYNVLVKLRGGHSLDRRERSIHEQGLVSVLRQLHDELDDAVFAAYGWSPALADEEILTRLVRLNAERAAEERTGRVRWLRPEFQRPAGATQAALDTGEMAPATPRRCSASGLARRRTVKSSHVPSAPSLARAMHLQQDVPSGRTQSVHGRASAGIRLS
jgi:hypothetical protein